MRKLFALFVLCIPFYSMEAMVRTGATTVQTETDDDGTVIIEEEQVWIGPGWYYGLWFSNEAHYHDWYRNHHHGRQHGGGHHRDGHHQDGGRRGGEHQHGGGEHGGRHH